MIFKKMGLTALSKIKIATLLFSVLVLMLLTNLQERSTIKRLNNAVTSIYEDRVVVGNYILTLSNDMEEVIHILQSNAPNKAQITKAALAEIDSLTALYDKTYLTETEQINFQKFKELCQDIKKDIQQSNPETALATSLEAQKILKVLSSIQVDEGKNKLEEVLSITNTRSFLSYLEIVIIIVISILIQKIILSTKPLVIPKNKDSHHLN